MSSEALRQAMRRYRQTEHGKQKHRKYMAEYMAEWRENPENRAVQSERDKKYLKKRYGHCDYCGRYKKLQRKKSPTICTSCYYHESKKS